MSDEPLPNSEIILYQTEDGRTRIQCRFENETLWLTQAQVAELFETTPQNVTLHLKTIFAKGELVEAATCKDYLQVRLEGGREVSHAGRISAEQAKTKAELEYDRYRVFLDSQPRAVDLDFDKAVTRLKKLPMHKKPKPPKS